jgi:integrative and conjugative element protein (TIGR02256 family)
VWASGTGGHLIPSPFSGTTLTYVRRNGGLFHLTCPVVETLRQYVQDNPDRAEAGGVLLGRHILGSDDIVVDEVTTPMPQDRRTRFRFFRSREPHQSRLDDAWARSAGSCTYLGEWHTHPERDPYPSSVDTADWKRKLRDDTYSGVLFFVIVGTEQCRVWEGTRRGSIARLVAAPKETHG